ncbi:hypothetical protein M9H77_18515 [Catharanthus roseus]|uniref:Uncharacterized protein n=1 Tax=Catharanthus roseus TaxID=4058 RepID=A0ACC0B7U6_CATRO|nr:hypothetical protein M9H77_18515 [Catharanthus roseus]
MVVKSNGLEGTWKVASLLIGTNIAPRSPNQPSDLRMIDVYIMDKMRSELRETTSALDIIKEATIKRSHYWWDENEIRKVKQGDPASTLYPPREHPEPTSKYGGDDVALARDARPPLSALLIGCGIKCWWCFAMRWLEGFKI